ncbi:MAG: nicotinate-nucleotide adenylyltransferase [Gammaproteobacteria bacterium]|nr:nicotinate-nucleotide adenylyltransferase [Gammaproteobacteria bacterium]
MRCLGLLGGTFDPVHCGHLRLALEMRERLALETVRLLPAPNPRLRDAPHADAGTRLAILAAAVADVAGLEVDDRELSREGPTRTVETLESLRADLPDASLCLLLGMDAFERLDEWHRFDELLDLAHVAVARRRGARAPGTGAVAKLIETHGCDDPAAVHAARAGRIILCDTPYLDISATDIRERLASGRNIRFLVPDNVLELINRNRYYTHAE